MNFVESFNLLGVEAKQIPCIKGAGEPSTSTEGEVGCLYMNTETGDIYKCTLVSNNAHTWELVGGASGLDLNNLTMSVEQINNGQRLSLSDGETTKTVDIPIDSGTDLKDITLSVAQVGDNQRLSMSDGTTTKTVDIPSASITDEQVQSSVETWLDNHPEATTTIEDGSVTFKKLADDAFKKIKNHIIDPAFTDITDNNKIQYVYVTSKSSSDGILTFGKTSSGQFRTLIKGDIFFTPGHIYYLDIQVKIDEPTATNASTLCVATQNKTIILDKIDTWQRIRATTKPTSTEGAYIKVGRDDKDTDPVTVHVKCPILVDLTEVFGAGNEPDSGSFSALLDELHDTNTYTNGVFKDNYTVKDIDNRVKIYAENKLPSINANGSPSTWGEVEQVATNRGYATTHISFTMSTTGGLVQVAENDIVYFACSCMTTDDNCTEIGIGFSSDPSARWPDARFIDAPVKDTWYRLSAIHKQDGQVCYPHISAFYPDTDTAAGTSIKTKCGICLNLTEIFGSGNEPNAELMDAFLSHFDNGWFAGTQNIFSANALNAVYRRYNENYNGTGYGLEDDRFVARSIVDKDAPCWSVGKYRYGITKPENVPIPHDFYGSVKTDSMFISDGQYGAWSSDASGEMSYGGHVFHGWNEIGTYRLSLMIGNSCVGSDQKREDEAAILVYSPTDLFNNPSRPLTEEQIAGRITPNKEDYYGGNPSLLLGRVRIGSDVHNEGAVFQRKKTTFYGDVIMAGGKQGQPPSNSAGEMGAIRYDDSYLYICTSPNTWKRCKLESY